MTQPKKNPKQAKATVKASKIRFGKKQRAEIIEELRPWFENVLSVHLKREKFYKNRLQFGVAANKEIIDHSAEEKIKNECPICERTPYNEYNYVHPHTDLSDQEAIESLRKLGFQDFFVKEYVKNLSRKRTEYKKERKSTFAIPNFQKLISRLGMKLRIDYIGISITAAALILQELFDKKGYYAGDGTIKKYLIKYFKETPHLSIQNWDGTPDTTKQLPVFLVAPILHGYLPESLWGCPGDIIAINLDTESDRSTPPTFMFAPPLKKNTLESVKIYPDAIMEAKERRIASIRLAAENAVNKTEKAAEDSINAGEKLDKYKEELKKKWDDAKLKRT